MSWSRFGLLCVIYLVAVPVTLLACLAQAWWGGGIAALGLLTSLVVAVSALFFRRAPSRCAALFVVAAAVGQVMLCWSFATEATVDSKYSDIAAAASFSNAFWLVGAGLGVVALGVGLKDLVTDGNRDLLALVGGFAGGGAVVFWVVEASAAGSNPLVGLIDAGPIALYALAAVIAAATPRKTLHRVTADPRPV